MSLYAPKTPPFDGGQSLAGLAGLDARARDIFRRIVESYLETGEPVGSRTLSLGGIALSPASIRNTMQDLTLAGLLAAPTPPQAVSRPMRACACSLTACWKSAT